MAKAKSKARQESYFGNIYERKRKTGIRYSIDYRDAGGKRRREVVLAARSREDAALVLKQRCEKVFYQINSIKQKRGPISFGDFADQYLREYAANKKSRSTDEFRLRAPREFFKDFQLHDIDMLSVERFGNSRRKTGNSEATVNRYYALLKKMFHCALDWAISPARIPSAGSGSRRKTTRIVSAYWKRMRNCGS